MVIVIRVTLSLVFTMVIIVFPVAIIPVPGGISPWVAISGPLSDRLLIMRVIAPAIFHLMLLEMRIGRISVIVLHHDLVPVVQVIIFIPCRKGRPAHPGSVAKIDEHG